MALASAVGGWDPDHLAEDWHMFAKCAVKTEGRVRCVPIFLPVLNYTPEEDGYWDTLCSRWTQAKRHALGVSEVVYAGKPRLNPWDAAEMVLGCRGATCKTLAAPGRARDHVRTRFASILSGGLGAIYFHMVKVGRGQEDDDLHTP
eukprot:Skav211936  [mRNA]  locus=scaffold1086:467720:480650:+ [translate_table: standard]